MFAHSYTKSGARKERKFCNIGLCSSIGKFVCFVCARKAFTVHMSAFFPILFHRYILYIYVFYGRFISFRVYEPIQTETRCPFRLPTIIIRYENIKRFRIHRWKNLRKFFPMYRVGFLCMLFFINFRNGVEFCMNLIQCNIFLLIFSYIQFVYVHSISITLLMINGSKNIFSIIKHMIKIRFVFLRFCS